MRVLLIADRDAKTAPSRDLQGKVAAPIEVRLRRALKGMAADLEAPAPAARDDVFLWPLLPRIPMDTIRQSLDRKALREAARRQHGGERGPRSRLRTERAPRRRALHLRPACARTHEGVLANRATSRISSECGRAEVVTACPGLHVTHGPSHGALPTSTRQAVRAPSRAESALARQASDSRSSGSSTAP